MGDFRGKTEGGFKMSEVKSEIKNGVKEEVKNRIIDGVKNEVKDEVRSGIKGEVKREAEWDAFVDITDVVCPMTFVKTKAAMEEIEAGRILKIKMNEGEPVENIPRSLKEEGHMVIGVERNNDGTFTILVKKGDL